MSRKMKDSGIEWIGEIPGNWEIIKLKYFLLSNDGGVWGEEPNNDNNDKVVIRSTEQTVDGKWIIETPAKRDLSNVKYENCRIFKDDLLMTKSSGSSLHIGKTTLADDYFDENECYYSNFIQRIRVKNINPRFVWYILNSNLAREQFIFLQNSTSGIGNINAENINNILVATCTIEEQKKIVDFLDKKVSEIDKIIKKTKESIEEYKKYKQSVITEVALGGLDKKVPMKNSGIEWIGQIPKHWKIIPFKFIMTERNEKNNPVQTEERLALSIDKGITTYAEKTTNLDRFKDDVKQYKLAHEGDLVFNSMNMIVGAIGYSNYFGCVSPVYYTYYDKVDEHFTSKYYEYIFRSKTMRKVLFSLGKGIMAIDRGDDKINTCRLKVSRDDLRCLKVPVPPEKEQQEIIKYLDEKCSKIDALIDKKEAFIEEMENYKKSLIYEYVTGKKEV